VPFDAYHSMPFSASWVIRFNSVAAL
jgi:hypothetical protein